MEKQAVCLIRDIARWVPHLKSLQQNETTHMYAYLASRVSERSQQAFLDEYTNFGDKASRPEEIGGRDISEKFLQAITSKVVSCRRTCAM